MFGVMQHTAARLAGVVALCLSALYTFPAQAVHLSTNGLGQVLIFPYYSTRGDNDTLFSVVNHSDDIKALKVRVLEGENGRAAANFNLYMPPNDVWTGSITASINGPVLRTTDASCTVPHFFSVTGQVDLTLLDIATSPDSGRASIDRLREGYVEVIEMGTIDPEGMGAFAEFRSDGTVRDCEALNEAWTGGTEGAVWVDDPQTDMRPPSGGLSGEAVFINVPGARAAAFQAVALNRFFEPQADLAQSLHTPPQDDAPSLAAASPAQSHVMVETPSGPEVVMDIWDRGIEAVAAALISNQVENQYAAQVIIDGGTEWVLTFPTKPFMTLSDGPTAPFTTVFDEAAGGIGDGQACELFAVDFFDRNTLEEPGLIIGVPPPRPPDLAACYTVNVLGFNNSVDLSDPLSNELDDLASDVLTSRLFVDVNPGDRAGFESGTATLRFNGPGIRTDSIVHEVTNSQSGRIYRGLPVVGFSEQTANNTALNALFGVGQRHRYQIEIVNP